MLGQLPTALMIKGKEYEISTDFRNILCIIDAFSDPELTDADKAYICLRRIFGNSFRQLPKTDYEEAMKEINSFIEGGGIKEDHPSPRVVNWQKDEQLIFPAVNKVAGCEIRALSYLHWWTFLGYFQSIDADSVWGYVLSLRQKKAKHKKLEKHEKEFWNHNRLLCAIDPPKDIKSAAKRADSIFDSILAEQNERGGDDNG